MRLRVRRRAAGDAGLQDHRGSVRRLLTFCARLFRPRAEGASALLNSDEGEEGAHRPHGADARQFARGDRGGLCRRHRRLRRPEGHPHRRHALRSAEAGDPGAHGIPGAGHRDGGRGRPPRPIRRSSASRCRSSPARIRPSASRPTRSPARRSSRAWASSTSTSRSISFDARLTRSRSMSAAAGRLSRDDHARRPRSTTPTRSRPAAPASSRA